MPAATTPRTPPSADAPDAQTPRPDSDLNPRYPLFDGLRGIAVLGILAFHVLELTGRIGFGADGRFAEVAGFEAVVVFFVISGFLLYRPYVAARHQGRGLPSARRYARRRALRILPGYWVVLTLLGLFPGIVGALSGDWWRYYGYLQLYSTRTELRGIPVAWTLCVEVTFYALLPVWAWGVRRLGARGRLLVTELVPLAALVVVGAGVQLLVAAHHLPALVGSTLAGQCVWLAVGMALAVVSVGCRDGRGLRGPWRALSRRPTVCWVLAALAGLALMRLQPAGGLYGLIALSVTRQALHIVTLKLLLQGSFAVLFVAPAIFASARVTVPQRLLGLAPVAWLGTISYSFYLWHLTIAEWIASGHSDAFSASGLDLLGHLHSARSLVLYGLSLLATVLVASLSYLAIERPFLRLKRRDLSLTAA